MNSEEESLPMTNKAMLNSHETGTEKTPQCLKC